MYEQLLAFAIAFANLLGPVDRGPADEVRATLDGIVQAVEADPRPPITGTREGDVALLADWSFHEARWRLWDPKRPGRCISGDGGKSLGPLQVQGIVEEVACAPATEAAVWLARAHDAIATCGDLTPIASGHCGGARRLVRFRVGQAARIRGRVGR